MHEDQKDSMWKHPWMWLVLGLPASVVVAGLVTFWIAASDPEATKPEPHRKLGFTVQVEPVAKP